MIEINGKQLCENCLEEVTSWPFCTNCGFNVAEGSADMGDPTMLKPGSVLLGKYIVGKVMGKGGFGVTYLAYDATAGRKVAIKEFFPYGVALRATGTTTVSVASMDNAEAFKLGAEKFYNEAKLVSRFNGNPNIVGVYEFFYENDTVYFAMEYLKGRTLKEYIGEHGTLTAGQALFIAQNVANALMAAHSSSVLHRDISPDNIIICDNGDVKLIDFGAARQVVAEHSQSFSVILKPGFAPLEQYQKKGNQGPWTDIYSLGATIYYTLTEDIPDDPMSRLDDDEAYQSNQYNVNAELWSVISKATELKIDDRYGDIFQLKNDLAKITFEAEPLVVPQNQPAEQMPEFQTAMPYGMTQTVPQTANQPVGVGAPAPAPAPILNTASGENVQSAPPAEKRPLKKSAKIAICGGAAAVVAAAIIIPISVNSGKDKGNYVPSTNYGTSQPYNNVTSNGAVTSLALSATTKVTDKAYTNSSGNTITYTGDWENEMPNGQGKGVWTNGDVYEGTWKDGKPNGQGKITYKSGNVYVGEVKDGERNGQCTYTYANGDVYVGEFKDGARNGQGTYTYADGDVYDGTWKDGKKNGQGTYTWADDGAVYVGEWKDGVRSGYGKYTSKDGKVQEGQWENDKFVGSSSGTTTTTKVTNEKFSFTYNNKKQQFTYTGAVNADGLPHGQGSCTFTNSSETGYKLKSFEGTWKDSQISSGKAIETNNNTYDGDFKNWVYDGTGTCTVFKSDGGKDVYSGNYWVKGVKTGQGEGKSYDKNGKHTYTYSGGWLNDLYEGKGTQTWYNDNGTVGQTFECNWKGGKVVDGQGTRTFYNENGKVTSKSEGAYKDGVRNGQGTYTWYNENGTVTSKFVGEYKDNKANGQGTQTWYDENGKVTGTKTGVWKDDKFVG